MEKLLSLLKDGQARTIELLALELNTGTEDILRQLEYLENMGIIRKVKMNAGGCGNCSNCMTSGQNNPAVCRGCLPESGFQNMGEIWEVV